MLQNTFHFVCRHYEGSYSEISVIRFVVPVCFASGLLQFRCFWALWISSPRVVRRINDNKNNFCGAYGQRFSCISMQVWVFLPPFNCFRRQGILPAKGDGCAAPTAATSVSEGVGYCRRLFLNCSTGTKLHRAGICKTSTTSRRGRKIRACGGCKTAAMFGRACFHKTVPSTAGTTKS